MTGIAGGCAESFYIHRGFRKGVDEEIRRVRHAQFSCAGYPAMAAEVRKICQLECGFEQGVNKTCGSCRICFGDVGVNFVKIGLSEAGEPNLYSC